MKHGGAGESSKPASDWRRMALGLAMGVLVGLIFRRELEGWPLALVLASATLWEQVCAFVASLSDWVSIKVKDVEVKRREELGRRAMEGPLQERERLTGDDDAGGLEREVDLGRQE